MVVECQQVRSARRQCQGSNDGIDWKPYSLPWKPGPPNKLLPIVAPYQPRLDWQLWFAALSRYETTPWLNALLLNLLKGTPETIALFQHNPFPDSPGLRPYPLRHLYVHRPTAAPAVAGSVEVRARRHPLPGNPTPSLTPSAAEQLAEQISHRHDCEAR